MVILLVARVIVIYHSSLPATETSTSCSCSHVHQEKFVVVIIYHTSKRFDSYH